MVGGGGDEIFIILWFILSYYFTFLQVIRANKQTNKTKHNSYNYGLPRLTTFNANNAKLQFYLVEILEILLLFCGKTVGDAANVSMFFSASMK